MKNIIIALAISVLFIDCIGKANNVVTSEGKSDDTIFVTYCPYIYETSVPTPCVSIAADSKRDSIELTIKEISSHDFNLIADFINHRKKIGQDGYCEARIHVKMGNQELCLGDFLCCACDIDDKKLNVSDFEYAIYKIKHLSGYYNCYDNLDIKYDELVRKFGIPEDYYYDSKPPFVVIETVDGEEVYDNHIEDIKRVALVKDQPISGD